MKNIIPWGIAIIAIVVAIISLIQPPRQIVTEVPKEVIKEIEKQVPLVLTDEEKNFLRVGKRVVGGRHLVVGNEEPLKNLKSFRVKVSVSDKIRREVNPEGIKSGIELELRKLGLVVGDEPRGMIFADLTYSLEGDYFDAEVFTFSEKLTVERLVVLP